MAGRGPQPKPAGRRARTNVDPVALRVIESAPTSQPDLPTIEVEKDGELTEFVWPARTVEWWAMWGESPLSAEFRSTDWSELLDTAFIHARFWRGDMKVAAELRLRVAKHGATAEDRARLRITFAQADDAESKRKVVPAASRERRGPLKAM